MKKEVSPTVILQDRLVRDAFVFTEAALVETTLSSTETLDVDIFETTAPHNNTQNKSSKKTSFMTSERRFCSNDHSEQN